MSNNQGYTRRSIRLRNYDYSQNGMYFVTICCNNKKCMFGDIVNGEMVLNSAGQMINHQWRNLMTRYEDIVIDECIIMPNHLHGLIMIQKCVSTKYVVSGNTRADTRPAPTTLGGVVCAFKSITTNEYIKNVKKLGWKPFNRTLWQRNYYEHIIRNNQELLLARQYIVNNPLKWDLDNENPVNSISNKGKYPLE